MSPGRKHAEDHSRPAARALLAALAFVLPFETPLFGVGPLTITSAELALYLVLAVWGLGVAWNLVRGSTRTGDALRGVARDPVARAVALWMAVVAVSALAAPEQRIAAIKFALRTASGVLLFFAARDLVETVEHASLLASGVVAGAVLSAAAALLESAAPDAQVWQLFRPSAFTAMGLRRTSGAFAYPTIAAMYWEAALALAVAVPVFTLRRSQPRVPGRSGAARGALGSALAGMLVVALVLSVTRSALVGASLACLAMLVFGRRAGFSLRVTAGSALVLLVAMVAASLAGHQPDARLGERLRWWRDGEWFRARFDASAEPLPLTTGQLTRVPIRIHNTGTLAWASTGTDRVLLSYHWEQRGPKGTRLQFEGARTALPRNVPPGDAVDVSGLVQAPDAPGEYRLRWDLLRDNATWFSGSGNPAGDQAVVVTGRHLHETPPSQIVTSSLEAWVAPVAPTRRELWAAAVRLWLRRPLLGVGPDNFRRLYPAVLALAPGRTNFRDDRLHANNFYLETLADLGLAGVAVLGALVFALVRTAQARMRARAGGLALASAVAVGTFFVHGLLDYFLEFTPTYALYWLLVALAGGSWRAPDPRPAPADSTR
jgi:O-antigen ligase